MTEDLLLLLLCAAFVGTGASLFMDACTDFLQRVLGIPSLSYAMLGRWIGHFPGGQFAHDNITATAPVRGELAIGWIAHYAIGIAFAALLLAIWGLDWARHPTPLPALIVGVGMVIAPFFIMQPAMGFGIAGSKAPKPNVARARSIMAHASFAVGLYCSAWLWALLIRL